MIAVPSPRAPLEERVIWLAGFTIGLAMEPGATHLRTEDLAAVIGRPLRPRELVSLLRIHREARDEGARVAALLAGAEELDELEDEDEDVETAIAGGRGVHFGAMLRGGEKP